MYVTMLVMWGQSYGQHGPANDSAAAEHATAIAASSGTSKGS